jgi:AbrB family looped-hinge helix DNA binding protein
MEFVLSREKSKGMKMGYINAKSSDKGQVTVPAEIRKHIQLPPGGIMRFKIEEDGTVTVDAKKQGARGLKGIFAKPIAPIDDDAEISATVWERNRPDRTGPRP